MLKDLAAKLEAGGKPGLEARWLLAKALGVDAGQVMSGLSEAVPGEVLRTANELVEKRLQGVPLQLLLGDSAFFGLRIRVKEGVLIPRPETEGLVELALEKIQETRGPRVLDVGCGTGAVALAIKSKRPDAWVAASDVDADAVALTQDNAGRLGLEVYPFHAAFTAGLAELDLVVSNPPYLPESYREIAPPELRYENPAALYSGKDGLDMPRELLRHAHQALKPGGWLLLELAPENIAKLASVAEQFTVTEMRRDLAGRLRYLALQKSKV